MNFTVDQFIEVFQRYNEAIWPLQLVAYALGLLALAYLFSRRPARDRVISASLAVFWGFMGVVFMWVFETDIMKAAYVFGALFLVEAALLLWYGVVRGRLSFERASGPRLWAGLAMIAYALVVYPIVGTIAGHGYPESPLFGVAPCPTAIFTFGMILAARRFPLSLAMIPLLWAVVGSNAAFRFGIVEDYGLLVSGLITASVLVAEKLRGRGTAENDLATARP